MFHPAWTRFLNFGLNPDDLDLLSTDDMNHFASPEDETREVINIETWTGKLADPKSVYECQEVTSNGFSHARFVTCRICHLEHFRAREENIVPSFIWGILVFCIIVKHRLKF